MLLNLFLGLIGTLVGFELILIDLGQISDDRYLRLGFILLLFILHPCYCSLNVGRLVLELSKIVFR
jgi:hypothetical protein